MAPKHHRCSPARGAACASPAPAVAVAGVDAELAATTPPSPNAGDPVESSASGGENESREQGCDEPATTTTVVLQSRLTPLVADHLVLSTPLPPVDGDVDAGNAAAPKRSPRALFGSFDGAEEDNRKRASAFTVAHSVAATHSAFTVKATTPNAFDGALDVEATLVIRKKWKRSLPPTPGAAAETISIFIDKSAAQASNASLSAPSLLPLSKPSGAGLVHQLVLPTTHSKAHPDLNVISPETVSRLLRGDFATQLARYALVDCRFSYEFAGGSLKTAQSLSDPASVEQQFLWHPPPDCARTALVFFCEFSATRAPKMLRHVRNLDRWIHAEEYPALFYPELYLIDGGYKNCFETMT
ncbi:hypothetical protein PybrP1_003161, partial [[Pythium] brassicae (nom. inval.)]